MKKFKITLRIKTGCGKRRSISRVIYADDHESAENLFWGKIKISKRYYPYGRMTFVEYLNYELSFKK